MVIVPSTFKTCFRKTDRVKRQSPSSLQNKECFQSSALEGRRNYVHTAAPTAPKMFIKVGLSNVFWSLVAKQSRFPPGQLHTIS